MKFKKLLLIASPTPWMAQGNLEITDEDGVAVAHCYMQEERDAIVAAVNAHNEMLSCLESATLCLKQAIARVEMENAEGNPILSAWLADARSAIAEAEGGK